MEDFTRWHFNRKRFFRSYRYRDITWNGITSTRGSPDTRSNTITHICRVWSHLWSMKIPAKIKSIAGAGQPVVVPSWDAFNVRRRLGRRLGSCTAIIVSRDSWEACVLCVCVQWQNWCSWCTRDLWLLDEEQGGRILPQGGLLVILYTGPRFCRKEQRGTKSISLQALSPYMSHLFCIFSTRFVWTATTKRQVNFM